MIVAVTSGRVVDASPVVGAVVLAIAVLAGVGIVWVWKSTRPARVQPGPPTAELRDETPAIVDLLTGGFAVDVDAVPATAVDLAARRFYDIESVGGGSVVLRLKARPPDASTLTPYEARVLRHIERNAVDGVTPAAVVTIGPDGVSDRWFTGFVREVTKHGRAQGLCRRRFDLKHLAMAWGLVVAGAAPAWILLATAPRVQNPNAWGSIGNLLVGIAVLVGFALAALASRLMRTDAQADTPAGRQAAAYWLGVRDHYRTNGRFEDQPAAAVAIWERHLAYATAMGLAPEVQRQLPFETEHDRHAWSRATGRWRRVKVRYQSFRPGWGQHPGRVAVTGLLRAAVFGVIAYLAFTVAGSDEQLDSLSDDQRRWVGLAALIVSVVCSVAAVFGAVMLIIGVADLVPRRTIEGEVVRRRQYRTGHRLPRVLQWGLWSGTDEHGMRRDYNRRIRHHLAIDDGTDDSILAFTVKPEIHGRAPQGARVTARFSPLLGYVADLTVTSPAPASAATERTELHPLAKDTIERAGGAVAGRIGGVLAAAESMTDESGRPLLDQTDDDGVTMRERLAESQDQLDRLRNDPRFANSPLGGILDALGGATSDDTDDD